MVQFCILLFMGRHYVLIRAHNGGLLGGGTGFLFMKQTYIWPHQFCVRLSSIFAIAAGHTYSHVGGAHLFAGGVHSIFGDFCKLVYSDVVCLRWRSLCQALQKIFGTSTVLGRASCLYLHFAGLAFVRVGDEFYFFKSQIVLKKIESTRSTVLP